MQNGEIMAAKARVEIDLRSQAERKLKDYAKVHDVESLRGEFQHARALYTRRQAVK